VSIHSAYFVPVSAKLARSGAVTHASAAKWLESVLSRASDTFEGGTVVADMTLSISRSSLNKLDLKPRYPEEIRVRF
jgi:hypothetical protein